MIAQRLGRRTGEFAIRNFGGALLGVMLAVMVTIGEDPQADIFDLIDAGMEHLESGLPL